MTEPNASAGTRPTRLVVTGASGFLGRAFVAAMAAGGREIVSLGRAPVAGARHVHADLADTRSLRQTLRRLGSGPPIDAIVHLAVSRHHRDFPGKALDLFHVNAAAAAELLDFARVHGVGRAVFGSTGSVYGQGGTTPHEVAPGDAEDVFRRPRSYFAASKLFADVMAELYREWLPVAVLRFYAPYGPGLSDRMLSDLVARVREGRPLGLPPAGSGLAFAAVYLDDAVAALTAALDQAWSETVNVAAPEVWSIEEAGRLIGRIVGREPRFERGADAPGHRLVPALARLNALVPGHRWIGLEEGLTRSIADGANDEAER